ncbi:site-specific integrase [Streptomyces pinistramenti]|uniref:site-specific integrase n=1 Tax=Streptomyces pinistramenti TaxID=2884812 RepID=UPI001D06409F|nr:site-specific integrase [Streptomyces pinistramenti]
MDPAKRSDGRFAARVYVLQPDGGLKPKWVYSRSCEECIRKRDELLAKKRDNVPVPARDVKLADWRDYWLENVILVDHSYATYAGYEQCVRLHLKPRLGAKRLASLTIADVREFRAVMLKSKGASTAKRALVPLRSALTAAMREDLLMRNVAQLVDLPDVVTGDYEPWPHEEAIVFPRCPEVLAWSWFPFRALGWPASRRSAWSPVVGCRIG